MVMLSLGMAVLTGIAAQVRIPLPNTPVPVTAQVFAVLVSGILLGGGYGALSQAMYLALGVAGVPWFTGNPVTVGYIIGFVPAAFLVGTLTDRWVPARRVLPLAGIMLAAVLVIYASGALWFAAVTRAGLRETLLMAVVPFIGFDAVKALAAAGIASSLLPRREYRA